MFLTAANTLGYMPATNLCFRTSCGTVTEQDANAAHADAWTSTSADGVFGCRRAIARLALPSTANWIAPTGTRSNRKNAAIHQRFGAQLSQRLCTSSSLC